jgi:hypothetical protein
MRGAHLYWVESHPGTNVGCPVSLRLLPSVSSILFSLFSILSLFFFFHSQSRTWTPHSQLHNIQLVIQIIYLAITYNSFISHKFQDSQHILDHKIHNPLTSHKNQSLENHNQSQEHQKMKNISYLCFPISLRHLSSACFAAPATYFSVSRRSPQPPRTGGSQGCCPATPATCFSASRRCPRPFTPPGRGGHPATMPRAS